MRCSGRVAGRTAAGENNEFIQRFGIRNEIPCFRCEVRAATGRDICQGCAGGGSAAVKGDVIDASLDVGGDPFGFVEGLISTLGYQFILKFFDPLQSTMIELFTIRPIPYGSMWVLSHVMQKRPSAMAEDGKSFLFRQMRSHTIPFHRSIPRSG